MATLQSTRCFLHDEREAAARCPECSRFYCRECVTEHKGRVICSGCLASTAPAQKARSGALGKLLVPVKVAIALGLIWFVFMSVGVWLVEMPTEFHDNAFRTSEVPE